MNLLILGAGPAGIMAAIKAARNGHRIILIDHNDKIGRKILSTGNGRCNLSNEDMNIKHFHSDHPDFCNNIFDQFGKDATMSFFEELGLYIKNKNGYLYPYTEQASTVLDVLRFEVDRYSNISVVTDTNIKKVINKHGRFILVSNNKSYEGDRLIIAAGSCASSKLGSDGSGYELARQLGHRIIKPLPALTSLKSDDSCLKQLAGIRTEARVSICSNDKVIANDAGELQLNKDNVSGIPIFQLCYLAAKELNKNNRVTALIDFLPKISIENLREILNRKRKILGDRPASDFLIGHLHKSISMVITKRCNIDINKKISDLTNQEVYKYVDIIKNFRINIKCTNSFDNAQVCCGGIDTLELTDNLESRLISGLYFAGEIIDVNGDCGGYNLQWAFSSGAVCGGNIK